MTEKEYIVDKNEICIDFKSTTAQIYHFQSPRQSKVLRVIEFAQRVPKTHWQAKFQIEVNDN